MCLLAICKGIEALLSVLMNDLQEHVPTGYIHLNYGLGVFHICRTHAIFMDFTCFSMFFRAEESHFRSALIVECDPGKGQSN
jgi:hypothetical protein